MRKRLVVLIAVAGSIVSGTVVYAFASNFPPVKKFRNKITKQVNEIKEFFSGDSNGLTKEQQEDFEKKQKLTDFMENLDEDFGDKLLDAYVDANSSQPEAQYIQPTEFYPGTDVPSIAYLAGISEVEPEYHTNSWIEIKKPGNYVSDPMAWYSYSGKRIDEEVQKQALKDFEQLLIDSGYVEFTDFEKYAIIKFGDDDLVYFKDHTFVRVRSVGGGPNVEIALNFLRFDDSEFVKFPIEHKRTPEQTMTAVEDRPTSPIAIEDLEWYEGFEGIVPKIEQFLTTEPREGTPHFWDNPKYDLSLSIGSEDKSGNSGFKQSYENFKTTLLALGYVQKGDEYFYLYQEDKIVKIYTYWSDVSWSETEDIYIYVNDNYDPIYNG